MTIETPGLYLDFPCGLYYADPCPIPSLTQSLAKLIIDRSPAHARLASPRLNPAWQPGNDGYDKDRVIGTAAHAYLLGRGGQVVVMIETNFRTKAAQETRDTVLDGGATPILPHHNETALAMVDAARGQLRQLGLELADGAAEVVLAWQEAGTWFRSLVDWLDPRDPRLVIDYKTTAGSAAPHDLGNKLADDGWDIQAAMHERGLDVLAPATAGRRRHLRLVQENYPPYALAACFVSEHVLHVGRMRLEHAVAIWKRCLMHNEWPAYAEIVTPDYPAWKERQWLEREILEVRQEFSRDIRDILIAG